MATRSDGWNLILALLYALIINVSFFFIFEFSDSWISWFFLLPGPGFVGWILGDYMYGK